MTWVTNSLRAQALKSRREDINFALLKLSQKLIDMQQYGAAMADGVFSDNEISTMPGRNINAAFNYMAGSSNLALSAADARAQQYFMARAEMAKYTDGQYNVAANGAQGNLDDYSIFNNFYKQALQELADREAENIHVEEKKIQQEQLRLETQLKAIDAEYEQVSKSVEGDIKNSAIKLA